jgi:hypothetical protein
MPTAGVTKTDRASVAGLRRMSNAPGDLASRPSQSSLHPNVPPQPAA